MLLISEYKNEGNVKFLLNYYFVFIPKRRKKVLVDEVAIRTRQIFMELATEKGWDILDLKISPNCLQLFIALNPADAPSLAVRMLKARSSAHLRIEFPDLRKIPSLWTSSYFVTTAGNISRDAVTEYIKDPRHSAN